MTTLLRIRDESYRACALTCASYLGIWLMSIPLSVTCWASDQEELLTVASKGDTASVQALIKKGVDVNGKDPLGNTALMNASFGGHLQLIELLLGNRANVNAQNSKGVSPLYLASFQGHTEIVRLLLGKGAEVDIKQWEKETPLIVGAQLGIPSLVETLLKGGANPNHTTVAGGTALIQAARSGNNESVSLLLAAGAKIDHQNVYGQTALISAVERPQGTSRDYLTIVKTLLSIGANPNLKINGANELMKYTGVYDGDTALSIARRRHNLEMIRLLEQAGAIAKATSGHSRKIPSVDVRRDLPPENYTSC